MHLGQRLGHSPFLRLLQPDEVPSCAGSADGVLIDGNLVARRANFTSRYRQSLCFTGLIDNQIRTRFDPDGERYCLGERVSLQRDGFDLAGPNGSGHVANGTR